MSEKPLFDKSMDELRESFVRARFAEEKVFGRADVEEWLAEQRQAITPEHSDTKHAWNSYLYKHLYDVANGREEEFLRQYASPNRTVPNDLGQIGGPRCEKEFLLMRNMAELFLRQGDELDFYWAYNYGPIAVSSPPGSPIYVFAVCHPHTIVRSLNSGDTMEAIMASWYRYGNLKARKFICDAMATKIAAARIKAEADFNSAVAVSSDGTKIVCVHTVVVATTNPVDKSRKLLSFPAYAFTSNKILRETKIQRDSDRFFNISSIYSKLIRNQAFFVGDVSQTLVDDGEMTSPRVFVTEEKFCPSPLPDGGVEIK